MTGLRVGVGTDVHAFGAASPAHVAGLEWPDEPALVGHSDGDVVAHACADALLNAAGLGDLGSFIGTDQPQWKGAAGTQIIAAVVTHLRANGFEPVNVGVQLIGNRPRLAGRREQAQQALSAAAGCPVNLSATTTDGLGLTGRGEGLAAIATALVNAADTL